MNTPTTDPLADRLIAQITDGTRAAVASVVEHTIDREYGVGDRHAADGARILAVAGLRMDLHNLFVEINGNDRGLDGLVDTQLRIMVDEGLAARRCQCREVNGHGHRGFCEGHTEHDVPTVNGVLLCGTCYNAAGN